MNSVLITGATGYIGSKLCDELSQKGVGIHAIRRSDSCIPLFIRNKNINWLPYDGSYKSISSIFKENKIDVVFHMASRQGLGNTYGDIDSMIDANIKLGSYILKSMSIYECNNLINAGSYWEHSNSPQEELANSYYSATKLSFQKIIDYYVAYHNLSAITLKLYEVYGEDDPREKIWNLLKKNFGQGVTIDMTGGEQEINIVHIDDVLNAFVTAPAKLQKKKHLKYFVGGNETKTLYEFVVEFLSYVNNEKKLKINWGGLDYSPNHIMRIQKGDYMPDWKPTISTSEGFKRILNAR